jgi:hypothetical protein
VECAVAAVRLATLEGDFDRNAHEAGVSEAEHVGTLDHQDRRPVRVVRMHQHIRQSLAQRLMHWRLFLALALFQPEGHLQLGSQFQVDLAVEVVEIA